MESRPTTLLVVGSIVQYSKYKCFQMHGTAVLYRKMQCFKDIICEGHRKGVDHKVDTLKFVLIAEVNFLILFTPYNIGRGLVRPQWQCLCCCCWFGFLFVIVIVQIF